MGRRGNLKRKSFFIDEETLLKAKNALRTRTDAETIRISLQRAADAEEFWRFMSLSRKKLKIGSIEAP